MSTQTEKDARRAFLLQSAFRHFLVSEFFNRRSCLSSLNKEDCGFVRHDGGESMFQINDSDFTWAISKAAVIVISALTSILGLAWVAVRKTSSK